MVSGIGSSDERRIAKHDDKIWLWEWCRSVEDAGGALVAIGGGEVGSEGTRVTTD